MIKSTNKNLNMVLRMIGNEAITKTDLFIEEIKNRNYTSFNSEEQIGDFFKGYMQNFYSNHSYQEVDNLRYYTGVAYKDINAILRGNWNYEANGLLTEDKKVEINNLTDNLENIFNTLNPISNNIKVYRGVNLKVFKDYGVFSICDLKNLVGEYYFDMGFTSTSFLKEKCFFDRNLEYHDKCDVLIEYLVPAESNDGIPLINDDLSYSKQQTEFLIKKGNLSKIIDVSFSEDGTKAYLKAVLMPQKILNHFINNNTHDKSTNKII